MKSQIPNTKDILKGAKVVLVLPLFAPYIEILRVCTVQKRLCETVSLDYRFSGLLGAVTIFKSKLIEIASRRRRLTISSMRAVPLSCSKDALLPVSAGVCDSEMATRRHSGP